MVPSDVVDRLHSSQGDGVLGVVHDDARDPFRDSLSSLQDRFDSLTSSRSNADRVYQALKGSIENNELRPGVRLAEEVVAEALQVSRTPVREALVRLEAEALVTRDSHGSLSVSQITVEQIVELYVVREALDGAAARLAAKYADAFAIQKLERINARMEDAAADRRFGEMADLNIQFHSVLAEASRNRMLATFIDQIHRFVKRFQTTTFEHGQRGAVAVAEHTALIEAIRQRDSHRAEAVAREHMRQALDVRIIMESTRPDAGAR